MVSVQSHVGGKRQVKREPFRGATDVLNMCAVGFKRCRGSFYCACLVLHVSPKLIIMVMMLKIDSDSNGGYQ